MTLHQPLQGGAAPGGGGTGPPAASGEPGAGREPERLRRTPLHVEHVRLGARFTAFAGWEMPVQYTGILEEHRAVRSRAGLFDLSHMGELLVAGPGARAAVQWLTTNDAGRLAPGRAQYTLLCRPHGGIVDDVILYCLDEDRFWLVVNAANVEKVRAWLEEQLAPRWPRVTVADQSAETALLALQGPLAAAILQPLTAAALQELRPFAWTRAEVAGYPALISRTGYTGEDGFELFVAADAAVPLWRALLAAGREAGAVPAGLGARDTLRLELRYPLYGQDIDETTTPLEAGLEAFVRFGKGPFVGRAALLDQQAAGVRRRLVGLWMEERGIPRKGYPVLDPAGRHVGVVTSGTFSPTLEKEIAMAYVETACAQEGARVAVDIRGRARAARVTLGRFVEPHHRRAAASPARA